MEVWDCGSSSSSSSALLNRLKREQNKRERERRGIVKRRRREKEEESIGEMGQEEGHERDDAKEERYAAIDVLLQILEKEKMVMGALCF